jgi:hypothetical protein
MWQEHVENTAKEEVVAYLKAYTCIRLNGTWNTIQIFQKSWYPHQDLNCVPPEYKSGGNIA